MCQKVAKSAVAVLLSPFLLLICRPGETKMFPYVTFDSLKCPLTKKNSRLGYIAIFQQYIDICQIVCAAYLDLYCRSLLQMHTEHQTASGVPKGYKKTYIVQIMEKSVKAERLFLPQLSHNVEHGGRFSGRLVFATRVIV